MKTNETMGRMSDDEVKAELLAQERDGKLADIKNQELAEAEAEAQHPIR
jgi:hypothetical protein